MLVCSINQFVINQKVYYINENTNEVELFKSCPLNFLPETLVTSCKTYNTDKIVLKGEKDYVEGIKDSILNINKNLNVEVRNG